MQCIIVTTGEHSQLPAPGLAAVKCYFWNRIVVVQGKATDSLKELRVSQLRLFSLGGNVGGILKLLVISFEYCIIIQNAEMEENGNPRTCCKC